MSVSHPAVKAVPAALLSLSTLLALSISLLLTACGGGGGGSTTPVTPTITSVTVVCSPGSIYTNQTSTCTPTVSGTGNYSSSVTWSVSPTSIGTVSSTGVLTPAGTGTATITATSTQDSTKSGNATVTVTAPSTITSVSVVCSPASILTTQTSTCTATVQGTGSFSSAVTWGATDGTITSSGVFTPAGTGTATITATSTQDTSRSGSVSIVVGSPTTGNEWTWMSGSSTAGARGVYGNLGSASSSNVPGARSGSVSWIDGSGNLWLFGGWGGAGDPAGDLNDLWEFNPSSKEWTWVSGSNTGNTYGAFSESGVYGTRGVASANNVPPPRDSSVSWTDSSGNLWLFGGEGFTSGSASGMFNDLWEFVPATKEWTWVSGSNTTGSAGIYGTQGVASPANSPGARGSSSGGTALSWTDSSGNLWLFGGDSGDDLWEFSTSTKEWTWVRGSSTGGIAVYGTQGVASPTNSPGSRNYSVGWTDKSGNFWLYGGATSFDLSDLWEFSPTTKEWTWVNGSNAAGVVPVYGPQGVSSASNTPGGRDSAVGWTDVSGNLWLFGGFDYDSTLGTNGTNQILNDLWEFSPTSKEWTWVGGSDTGEAKGVYGAIGTASASNVPGARGSQGIAVTWTDSSGNSWLFGGVGYDSAGTWGSLNDLWRYQP